MAKTKTFGPDEINAALQRLTEAIFQRHPKTQDLVLLGIANGGIELAKRLASKLGITRVGTIDISFHRDDIGLNPIPKEFSPTIIPWDVHGTTVILVDDVLFSGRTIKAALDELFDHGRPTKVELAVLVDRNARMLPMAADYIGMPLETKPGEKITISLHPNDPSKDVARIEAGETQSKIENSNSKIR